MHRFTSRHGLAAVIGAMVLATFAACSSETGGTGGGGTGGAPPDGSCYTNPLGCEDGTTCAFDDEDGEAMSCLPAGPKAINDPCTNTAGEPECGQGLVCLQLQGEDSGACAKYCDSKADCINGDDCAKITTAAGRRFYACAATG